MGWENVSVSEEELRSFDRYFRKEAKFYADEDVEPILIELLRDLGFKVQTAGDAGLEVATTLIMSLMPFGVTAFCLPETGTT